MQLVQKKWKATSSGRTYKDIRWGGKLYSGFFCTSWKIWNKILDSLAYFQIIFLSNLFIL